MAPTGTRIARQTVVITALSLLGILTNLVGNLVSAYFYGATQDRDAYLLALVIPTYLSAVMSGVLSTVFLPIFEEYRQNDPRRAWRIASTLVNVTALLSAVVVLACVVFAHSLVGLLAPGYGPVQTQQTVALLRIAALGTIFAGINSLFSILYYADHRFVRPALVSLLAVGVTVIINVALNSWIGIASLAVGSVIGSALTTALLLPAMLRPERYTFCLDIREEGLRRVSKAASPLLLVSLLFRFNTGFERMIAASLPSGSISVVAYASQLTLILSSLISGGIATTAFPLISQAWAAGDMAATARHIATGTRVVLLLTLPIAAGLVVFGPTFVELLLERGAFKHDATLEVSQCLALLIGSFVAGGLNNVLSKVFYATHKTLVFSFYNAFETFAYLGLALVLSRAFSIKGLAAAASIRDVLGLTACLLVARPILRGQVGRQLLLDALKIGASSLVLLLGFYLADWWFVYRLPASAMLAVAASCGAVMYGVLTLYVFRIEDARWLLRKVAVKLQLSGYLAG